MANGVFMKSLRVLACLAVVLVLSACNKKENGCSGDAARAAMTDIVHQQLERAALARSKNADGSRVIDLGKIRAAVQQVVVVLDDIRTDKSDSSSGKSDCTATLRLKFSTNVLNDAFSARQKLKANSVEDLADSKNIDHKADTYWSTATYHVQPTDDGQKVVAQLDDGATLFDFGAEVIVSSAALNLIDQAQQAEQAQKAQTDAALAEQRAANLAAARAENQLALQEIKQAWADLAPWQRQQILTLQRTWMRKKDADCLVEAANATASTNGAPADPAATANDREIARLTCDTREEQARARGLAQLRQSDAGNGYAPNQPSY